MAARGRPQHKPSKAQQDLVRLHCIVGTPLKDIARIIGIQTKTLMKHYRKEIDHSKQEANARVGGHLYNKCINGDTTAMIFWLKTQCGWREQKEELKVDDVAVALKRLAEKLPD